jgi:hypothetical protein
MDRAIQPQFNRPQSSLRQKSTNWNGVSGMDYSSVQGTGYIPSTPTSISSSTNR